MEEYAGVKNDQLSRVSNSAAMPLSWSSLSSLSMLDKKSSFTYSPMPYRDSLSFRIDSSSLPGPLLISILLGQYQSGELSWLLMSCTIGWFLGLVDVVLLGKQVPLLSPIELLTELLVLVLEGQLLNVLCSQSCQTESLFMENPSVCPPKDVLYLILRSSVKKTGLKLVVRLSLLGKLRNILGASLAFSLGFSFESASTALLANRFSFACSPTLCFERIAFKAYPFSSSKFSEGRSGANFESEGCGRSSARERTASNLTSKSSRDHAEARCWWSKRSQSLRKPVMLRTMACSPSGPEGRQILTLFSSTSGFIQTAVSPRGPRKTMFSLRKKHPYLRANRTQATTILRAAAKARQFELSSLSLGRTSGLSSSSHTSSMAGCCLTRVRRGVPSMCCSALRRKASSCCGERMGSVWQIRSFCFMIIYRSMALRSAVAWPRWPRSGSLSPRP